MKLLKSGLPTAYTVTLLLDSQPSVGRVASRERPGGTYFHRSLVV